ncbi:neutral zinc metallopeptidase [Candidatus Mycobacterium wuenschmannii]|uniref:Neutral zinc metallopeptidase n=1 Tax=Candidatus Mycobacterium wuenschmannii TaxID=3027808 RepID=A0ABY8VRX0_9MYCO|nr:neutral zinc metallopeptidase [Candidatus Mycobacterium wuenschmannii]WIM86389.1 neutral zinc metallopeptidase [Candidatus Mycobacterium wuenschmannii]
MTRVLRTAVVMAGVLTLVLACSKPFPPPHVAPPTLTQPNPSKVADKPVENGFSGLRPDAPPPTRTVTDGDGGEIDNLAALAVSDVEQFWTGAYAKPLDGKFAPVNDLFSYDSRYKNGMFCASDTHGVPNAFYCPIKGTNCPDDRPSPPGECTNSYNTIGWDRGVLLPEQRRTGGDMGVVVVLAHEYGHAVQRMAGLDIKDKASATVGEQQADCYAGVYMRWVADGKSKRFTLSTGDGLTKLLSVMIGISDSLVTSAISERQKRRQVHGSAFERVTAFQFGFDGGVPACAGIDEKEIEQRRGNLPKEFVQEGETGEFLISPDSAKTMVEVLGKLFPLAPPPQLSFDPAFCPDARPNPTASYCPATNTITVDMPALTLMGTSLARGGPFQGAGPLFGDYSAFSVLASRYLLAAEKQHGTLPLDNTNTGLRTACLTGVFTTKLAKPVKISSGVSIALSGGDLDEAVSGILTNGQVAGDVNGQSAASVFARVNAFRSGVLGDEDGCYKRWP